MRFGIMAMQVQNLVPAELSAENIPGHLINFDQAGLVKQLFQKGFNPIEIGGDLGMFLPHTFSTTTVEKLAALKNEIGVQYTIHLPLWSVEPSTPLNTVRVGSVNALVDCIKSTQLLEPEVYVLHATGALAAEFYRMPFPKNARSTLLKIFQSNAMKSIESILDQTGISPGLLAVETIEFPFDLTIEMIEKFDLSICLDTGHVLSGYSGSYDLFELLEICLPRLAEVHLHDAPKFKNQEIIEYGKDHRPLGKGDLEIETFLNRIGKAKFDGPIIFELRVDEAVQSMNFIRDLGYAS